MTTPLLPFVKHGFIGLALTGFLGTAHAADRELLDILLSNGSIDQEQYEQLLEKEELGPEDVEDIGVSFDSGGLTVVSADEAFEFNLGGRLHLDYAHHEYDDRIGADPVNGATTRRARLEMNGRFATVWGWAAEVDFAENEVEVKDFKLGYEGEDFTLYVGNQKQPYSLSLEMSSNDIPFLERSIDNYLVGALTDRAIGLRLDTGGERWFLAAGVFGEEIGTGTTGDEGWGTAGRFVYAPLLEENRVLHLGLRGAYREMRDQEPLRFRDRTTDFSGLNIVDTGLLADARSVTLYGPEFALAMGPLTLLSEYSQVEVERAAASDLQFQGWHVGAAWSLTGESRAAVYDIGAGEFKGVRADPAFDPRNGSWGGFELVARYASLDLNDDTLTGGSEDVVSAGLNWYPSRNVRFLFDWSHILDTDESNPLRRYAPGLDVFTVRAQYNY